LSSASPNRHAVRSRSTRPGNRYEADVLEVIARNMRIRHTHRMPAGRARWAASSMIPPRPRRRPGPRRPRPSGQRHDQGGLKGDVRTSTASKLGEWRSRKLPPCRSGMAMSPVALYLINNVMKHRVHAVHLSQQAG
jgi:hypothetical protein